MRTDAVTDQEFVLYPPRGWLNRIDEVLRYHGAATHDSSLLGEALGNLIRSWEGTEARESYTAPGPADWGTPTRRHAGECSEYDRPVDGHDLECRCWCHDY